MWAVGLAPAAPRVFIVTLEDEDESKAAYTTYTASDVAFFVWDLAQTGLAWWQSTRYRGGKKLRRTDIGLAPA